MMTARGRDRLTGLALVVVAGLWCLGVVETIPDAYGDARLGPRGFPLALGVLMGALGAALVAVAGASEAPKEAGPAEAVGESGAERKAHAFAAAATVLLLAAYAALLEHAGFLIATAATTAAAVLIVNGPRRPFLVAGMALGMALGIYLALGKLLGVYLPYGRWINVAF